MALHPGGSLLAVGSGEGKIRFWQLPSGKRDRVIDARHVTQQLKRVIRCLAFLPDGSLILGREDQTLQLWPPDGDAPRWTSAPQRNWIPVVALSRDGGYAFSAG